MRSFALTIGREFSKGNCPVNLGTEGVVAQMVLCVQPSPHFSVSGCPRRAHGYEASTREGCPAAYTANSCSVPEISWLNSTAESPGSQGASDLRMVGERGERSEKG